MIERIKKIMAVKNLNPSKFADRIGVPRSTISHVLSGRNNPSLELVQKILDHFPDIRTEWLLRGHGYMQDGLRTLFPDEADHNANNDPLPDHVNPGGDAEKGAVHSPAVLTEAKADGTEEGSLEPGLRAEPESGSSKIVKVITLRDDGTFMEYSPGN